jgi:hypothetical protein
LFVLFWHRRKRNNEDIAPAFPSKENPNRNVPFVPYTDLLEPDFVPEGMETGQSSDIGSYSNLLVSPNHITDSDSDATQTITSTLPSGKVLMSTTTVAGSHLLPEQSTTTYHSGSVEAVRQQRQMELDRLMRAVNEEMNELKLDLQAGATSHPVAVPSRSDNAAEVSDLKELIRTLQEQIDYLRDQQQSSWAQGLSDEAPPQYTAVRSLTIRR